MNTRRTFLQTGSLALAGHLSHGRLPAQQTAGPIHPGSAEPSVNRDYWNDFPNYLATVVNAARERRKAALSSLKSAKDVTHRASFVTNTVWQLIGGQLEKTPLNVKQTGTVERNTYRIEKL